MLKRLLQVFAGLVVLAAASAALWLNAKSLAVPIDPGQEFTYSRTSVDAATSSQAITGLLDMRRKLSAPGIQASVRRGDEELFNYAAGWAQLDPVTPVTPNTTFPIGSVSKSMAATIVGRYVDRGQLDFDEPAGEILPELPPDKAVLTLRQLLSHQAGIRHYGTAFNFPFFSEFHSMTSYPSSTASLVIFIDDPLLFDPDTDFSYSTYGYTLASAVMETRTLLDFGTLLDEEIVEPAGLENTALDKDPAVAGRASSYPANPFHKLEVLYVGEADVSYKWAGGGIVSTASDLTRFAAALLGDRLVSPATRAVLFTARTLPDGAENAQNYGLGFRIKGRTEASPNGNLYRAVYHGGTALGSQAYLVMLPEIRLSVAVLVNVNAGGSSLMVEPTMKLLDLFVPLAKSLVPSDSVNGNHVILQ